MAVLKSKLGNLVDWFGDDAQYVYNTILGMQYREDGRSYGLIAQDRVDHMYPLFVLFYDEVDEGNVTTSLFQHYTKKNRVYVGSFDTPAELVGVLKLMFPEN